MNPQDDKAELPAKRITDNRSHFLVDINTVFPFIGKRYFLIFYFGRHLHPRQTQRVNQRRAANWFIVLLLVAGLVGIVYGIAELVSWRLQQGAPVQKGQSTHLTQPQKAPASATLMG